MKKTILTTINAFQFYKTYLTPHKLTQFGCNLPYGGLHFLHFFFGKLIQRDLHEVI